MTENERLMIIKTLRMQGNRLAYRSGTKKCGRVPRVAPGYIKLHGKIYSTKDVINVVISEQRDQRASESFEMARAFPEMIIGRKSAADLGLSIYRTGEPCLRGHFSWRYVSSSACVACRGLLLDATIKTL